MARLLKNLLIKAFATLRNLFYLNRLHCMNYEISLAKGRVYLIACSGEKDLKAAFSGLQNDEVKVM